MTRENDRPGRIQFAEEEVQGARIKVVGGDSGRCERETFVDEILIAPSERAVIDVRFDQVGPLTLEHRTPQRTSTPPELAGAPVMPGWRRSIGVGQ